MAVERSAIEGLAGLSGELERRHLAQDGQRLWSGASGQKYSSEQQEPHAALRVAF
jgi:uncharacterized protein YukE